MVHQVEIIENTFCNMLQKVFLFDIICCMEARKEKVKQAIANEKLEGLNISKNTKKTLDEYIAGKISAKEAAQQVYARYGVK